MRSGPRTLARSIVQQPAAQLYARLVAGIRQRIRTAQVRTALAANAELVMLYWEIGRDILIAQQREGWGAKVIDRLAADLRREFPRQVGYSARNLKYMRAFAEAWPDAAIVHQLGAQIPWSHNCVLLDRVKARTVREFYIRQSVAHGWSRGVLMQQIDTAAHRRIGRAATNFPLTLPSTQSDLARELLKDPYVFRTGPLNDSAHERALERALLARLKDFLLELGSGFAFVGNQHRLEVAGEEFFLDLLFYHTRLHCYVVIDLKVGDFQPEFVGKMSFYQTAIDRQVKTAADGPTIGIILCRGQNKTVVEYTLHQARKPVAVAGYRLLPAKLKAQLPDASQLQDVLATIHTPTT